MMRRGKQYEQQKRKKLLAAALTVILASECSLKERSVWVKPWVARRRQQGFHHNLFLELQLEDPHKYRR